MKKNLTFLLLLSIAALNLHGMEDGQRTPKRQRPESTVEDGQRTPKRQKLGSTIVTCLESDSNNERLAQQIASLKSAVAALAFSPERDSSIERISLSSNVVASISALQRGVRLPHKLRAICAFNARIAGLQGVEQQADQARSVSQITSMKAAHEFGCIVMSARRAHIELTALRDDIANGGDLLTQEVQRYASFRLNFDAAENENARNSSFLDILGEGSGDASHS